MKKNFTKQSAVSLIAGAKEDKKVVEKEESNELLSERTQLLLKKSTKDGIKDLAWKNHLSMNGMINKILEEYLEKNS